MTREIITQWVKGFRVVVPEQTEECMIDKQVEVWTCDYCANPKTSRYELNKCVVCGKHACLMCRDENFITIEHTCENEDADNGFDGAWLNVCKTCYSAEVPEIINIMRLIMESEQLKDQLADKSREIVDAIERFK